MGMSGLPNISACYLRVAGPSAHIDVNNIEWTDQADYLCPCHNYTQMLITAWGEFEWVKFTVQIDLREIMSIHDCANNLQW